MDNKEKDLKMQPLKALKSSFLIEDHESPSLMIEGLKLDDGMREEPTIKPSRSSEHHKKSVIISKESMEINIPAEEQTVADTGISKSSVNSFGSDSEKSGIGGGRELVENYVVKILQVKWVLLSLLLNLLLVIMLWIMYDTGLSTFAFFALNGPIVAQVGMHLIHIVSEMGLRDASGVLFGYLISRKSGYSFAITGFMYSSLVEKIAFPGRLSYKSKCKKFLQYNSYIWMFSFLLLIVSFYCSSQLSYSSSRIDSGNLACLVYTEDGEPFDRGFPDMHYTMGVAEIAFGTSFGILRSEQNVNYTTSVFGPQLVDICPNGANIVAQGFVSHIFTTCACSKSIDEAEFMRLGVNVSIIPTIRNMLRPLLFSPSMVNSVKLNDDGNNIIVNSFLTGANVCGGSNFSNPQIPVCFTTINNHSHAEIMAVMMTDGSTSSNTVQKNVIRKVGEPADVDWLHIALINVLEGPINFIDLPQNFPGTINPLVSWASENVQGMTASLLEAGIETTFALILRSSYQRSYNTKGEMCKQNIVENNSYILSLTAPGLAVGFCFCIGNLIIGIISLLMCFKWFASSNPIGPAIRLMRDRTYYNVVLTTPFVRNLLQGTALTVNSLDVWPRLDVLVRVGEKINTKEDPSYGVITIDKPKFVADLVLMKSYT